MKKGRITLEPGAMPDRVELEVAEILSTKGFSMMFLKPVNLNRVKTPDLKMYRRPWEIKTLRTKKMSGVEQALKRATKQAENIVVSNLHNRELRDDKVERFLRQKIQDQKTIEEIIFIRHDRTVVDIRVDGSILKL